MTSYWKPRIFLDSDHNPRRTGFEFEFGNLTVRQTVQALHDRFGGRIRETNAFKYTIEKSALGDIKILKDAELLHSAKYREVLDSMEMDMESALKEIEQGIDKLSSFLIPCEVVTDPLAFEDFSRLDDLVEVLEALDARGTQTSLLHAFGLHINPSVPGMEAKILTAYMQAFLLLNDWIVQDAKIDFSRRYFTSFIDPFPASYLEKVLDLQYTPNTATFINDYLSHNPTRNRALDLLPVLYELDPKRVLQGVKKSERSLLSGRPAFHYRLPDCRIGEPEWSVAAEWNRWWYVEELAANEQARHALLKLWATNRTRFLVARKQQWIEITEDFINQHFQPPSDSA